jgi:hypothetical protein
MDLLFIFVLKQKKRLNFCFNLFFGQTGENKNPTPQTRFCVPFQYAWAVFVLTPVTSITRDSPFLWAEV